MGGRRFVCTRLLTAPLHHSHAELGQPSTPVNLRSAQPGPVLTPNNYPLLIDVVEQEIAVRTFPARRHCRGRDAKAQLGVGLGQDHRQKLRATAYARCADRKNASSRTRKACANLRITRRDLANAQRPRTRVAARQAVGHFGAGVHAAVSSRPRPRDSRTLADGELARSAERGLRSKYRPSSIAPPRMNQTSKKKKECCSQETPEAATEEIEESRRLFYQAVFRRRKKKYLSRDGRAEYVLKKRCDRKLRSVRRINSRVIRSRLISL